MIHLWGRNRLGVHPLRTPSLQTYSIHQSQHAAIQAGFSDSRIDSLRHIHSQLVHQRQICKRGRYSYYNPTANCINRFFSDLETHMSTDSYNNTPFLYMAFKNFLL
jgi:hypothetical protein